MGVEAQALVQRKAPVPFRLAYKFVLIFLVVYFARPEDWIPGLHYLHLALVAGILAIVMFLAELGSAARRWPRECVYLFLFVGQMFLTIPFAIWRGGAFQVTRGFANVVPMILVVSLAVNTLPRLRRILFWQAASMAAIAAVAVVKFRHAGGRLEGVLNGYANPNDFALAVVVALPICLAFMLRSRNTIARVVWLGCIGVMTYALVLSASRSGSLAFGVAMCITLWYFAIKGRHKYLLALIAGFAACALLFGGSELKLRYEAMAHPDLDQKASGSSEQRERLLRVSIASTFKHPIFGLGPGNFQIASGVWRVTHNTYTQISSEMGLPGFILYVLILSCAWKNLSRVRRMIRGDTELRAFAIALHASLAAFLVGSFFASEGYEYFTYFLIAYTTAVYQIAKHQSQTGTTVSRPKQTTQEKEFREQPTEAAWSVL
jgi:O-antigen ligase